MERPTLAPEGLSLDLPNCEAYPLGISLGSVLSFICTTLCQLLIFLLALAAALFCVALQAFGIINNLNNKGRKSDDKHRKTNNSTQDENHRGDQNLNTSTTTACLQQSPVKTNTSAPNDAHRHRCAIQRSFNNYGDGEQDYCNATITGSEHARSFNNETAGLQALPRAKIHISASKDAFNNTSSGPQTLRDATIDFVHISNQHNNTRDNNAAVCGAFNNTGERGTQNYDGVYITRM